MDFTHVRYVQKARVLAYIFVLFPWSVVSRQLIVFAYRNCIWASPFDDTYRAYTMYMYAHISRQHACAAIMIAVWCFWPILHVFPWSVVSRQVQCNCIYVL